MGCGTSRRVGVVEPFNTARDPNPPIRPPKRKKRDVVSPPAAFAHIDEHALKAPSNVRSSVASLAQYLIKPARNDMEKVRAIYRWIADNISYDTDGFFSGNYRLQNADSVLQRGAGVCDGYATIFSALCNDVGIRCKTVSGFSKGFEYDPEVPFTLNTKTDHAWNMVFINGEWRQIESTWGAGYLNSENKFEKCFNELYFLTDPEDFVTTHFPFIDMNLDASLPLQLLQQPWSLEKFNKALCPQTKGIEWGFKSSSHNTQVITVDKEYEITFRTCNADLEDVLCHLRDTNTKRDFSQYVLLRKKREQFTVKVTPPSEGKYELELFGKPVGFTGTTHDRLITFVLRCQSALKYVHPYPYKIGTWGAKIDAKRYGFSNDIFGHDVISAKNGETELRIKTERHVSVTVNLLHSENVSDLSWFVFKDYEENTLVVKARCPYAGYYKLTLFAKDPQKETTSHDHIADFLIDSKTALDKFQTFPETYTIAQKYGCHLIQPLIGDLPANQDVGLRLRSDQLTRVMINKDIHNKGGIGELDITVKSPASGETLTGYGSPYADDSLDELMGCGTSRRVGVVQPSNTARDPNPPIRPPKKKKRDVVSPPAAFDHIDEHALKPLIGDLRASQDVRRRLRSDQLTRVMINKDIHNKGGIGELDITVKSPASGETLTGYGSPYADDSLDELMGCGTSRRVGVVQPSNTARVRNPPIRPPKKKKRVVASHPAAFAHIDEHSLKPLIGDLPASQDVRLRLRSDQLTRVVINKDIHNKDGIGELDITVKSPASGEALTGYESPYADDSLDELMGCGTSRRVGVVQPSNRAKDPNPPIRPPKRKKRDVVSPPASFAHIDEHSLKAPSSVRSSVASLAQYLIKPARNDMEKVRAIYRWIADNISYDTDALFSGNYGSQNADSVLQRGACVCGGYANIFSALCNEVGIPCKKVSGFSKGSKYDPEVPFTLNTKTNHAWNIVFINGEWRQIESTWGAGNQNSENKFEKSLFEFNFLTDPEDFVTTHFPFIEKNLDASLPLQLLQQPWSLEKFNKALCLTTKGMEWGFKSSSHNTPVITVDKECEIKFKTRNVALQDVCCHLLEKNTKRDNKQCVLLRKKGDMFTVKVTPPAEGTYVLELYGKPVEATGTTYKMMNEYVLLCHSALKDVHPYPDKNGTWGAKTDAKRYGFSNDIFGHDVFSAKNGETELRIKTERHVSVIFDLLHSENVSDLSRFVFKSYDGNTLVVKARFPYAGYYMLTLFAKDPEKETTSHDHIADFLIDSKTALDKVQPFPETYTIVQKYGCHLIQPLIGDLPANQYVRLRLRSDQLPRVMINEDIHNKGGNGEFDITVKSPASGETLTVYGSPRTDGIWDGLYVFKII